MRACNMKTRLRSELLAGPFERQRVEEPLKLSTHSTAEDRKLARLVLGHQLREDHAIADHGALFVLGIPAAVAKRAIWPEHEHQRRSLHVVAVAKLVRADSHDPKASRSQRPEL